MDFLIKGKFEKIDNEERNVFGWFSVVEKGNKVVIDGEDEIIKSKEIEEAAYAFVLNERVAGKNHVEKGVGQLIESIVFTKEKQETLGIDLGLIGWWGGFHITDDDVWKSIKNGEFKSFSIGGKADKIPVEIEE